MFNRLTQFRRIATRCDKTVVSFGEAGAGGSNPLTPTNLFNRLGLSPLGEKQKTHQKLTRSISRKKAASM